MNKRLQLKNNLSSILQNSNLKPVLYNSAMSIAQFVALSKLKQFSNQCVPVSKKKIIIHSVHGTYLSAIYKEGALALALRLAGHDTKMLFCNKRISSCCALFTVDHPASKRDCSNCVHFSTQFCFALNIPRLIYDDFSFPEDRLEQLLTVGNIYPDGQHNPESIIYKGVHIGRHAETGTQRYFKGKQVSPEIYHKHFISKILDASVVVDIADRVLKEEKPDIIVTSHSCYSEFGPFSEFFKNNKIPVFTWFTGYGPNTGPDTLIFDIPEAGKNFESFLSLRGSKQLTETEENELQSFINKRKSGSGELRFYGFTNEKKNFNFLNGFSTVYGLFPNTPWDSDPSCKTLFFDSILDWVSETIKFFSEHKEMFLIIKTHPSEKLQNSSETVYDKIKEKFNKLPMNVLLLPPDTKMSVYDLFPNLTAGIVSNSTTGLEMLVENVPVITVGEAHYRGKGFTYDPKTKQEYFDFLERGFFTAFNRNKLKLYAYYYFIKSFLPFRVFYKKNLLNIGFRFKTLDELKENDEMNHIVDCITKNKIFQDW